MQDHVITGHHPAGIFDYFAAISRIPRGSGHEAAVADYLVAFAEKRGLLCYRDENNNVLLRKPATPGRETEAPLLFQGHTDMVCEKNADVVHDFERDPIRLIQSGHTLRADGTTLGADNGIGVAMMLCLLDGTVASHPTVECLFTTEEETGMGGAIAFDYSKLTARHMVNLDSEEENIITVGCAGGIRTDLTLPVRRETYSGAVYCRVCLGGLGGGHSGADIHTGRTSANLLIGRLLLSLPEARLVSIEGGAKDNAIAREAEAVIAVPHAAAAAVLLPAGEQVAGELVEADRHMAVRCETLSAEQATALPLPMDAASTARVLGLLANAPCGVLAMSREVEGLVEFSRNLGILRTTEESVNITFTSRASQESRLDGTVTALDALAAMLGGTARHHSRYPGWEYQSISPLRDAYTAAYGAVMGGEPQVLAIHAGLECGYVKKKLPEMDIISVGPNMRGIHSPDEVLYLDSVERVWRILEQLIAAWHQEN